MRWLLTTLALATPVMVQDRPPGPSFATRSEVIARHGAAATSHPDATRIAVDVLRAGGNAIDAAIAANAVLALAEPTGCGLGGDLFAIVWDADKKRLHGLNASGRSPMGLTRAEFEKRGLDKIPARGVLPISVPGCVDGWFTLHERLGRLPMRDVLAPAIRLAREGVAIHEVIAYYWGGGARVLRDEPGFAEVFMPGGRAPVKGDVFQNPALANTLELLAAEGRDAFYGGSIGVELVRFVQELGGFLALEDLQRHRSEWVAPVSTSYRGYDVWELPPNGQGIAALQILNVLEGYDLKQMGFGSVDHIHVFVEAKKLAFEDRARLYADMDFADVPVQKLISKGYAEERRQLIDANRAAKTVPVPALEEGDTIYLTTADRYGNMVSLIQSNYRGFGSGVTPPKLGFGLQDRGELFDLEPGRANSYAPGKRPFHTIIPAFVTKAGEPFMSYGVMGGAMQPQGHAWVVSNMIDFGMNLQEAGDAPRVRHGGSSQPTGERMVDGGYVMLESGHGSAARVGLEARGHVVRAEGNGFGGYQAIRWDAERRVWFAASESRKDGHAAGY